MNQGYSPQTIAAAWHETLDLCLETGESPLFCVDTLAGGLAGVHAAMALALLDAQRSDLMTPIFLIGGVSPEWLAALWCVRPQSSSRHTPPSTVAFSAPDVATQLAAQNTFDTRRSAFYQRPAQLPPWVQLEADADKAPVALRWDVAPLRRFSASNGRDGWLAWAGVVTAIALLFIALLS